MENSRRDLLNDMAEHRLILKNNLNTYHPRCGFIHKTGGILQNGFCFYCVPNIHAYTEVLITDSDLAKIKRGNSIFLFNFRLIWYAKAAQRQSLQSCDLTANMFS